MSSGGGHSMLPGMGLIEKLMHSSHEGGGYHLTARPLIIIFAAMVSLFFFFAPEQSLKNFNLVVFLSPLWVSVMFGYNAMYRFHVSRRVEFIKNQKTVLLELRMPRETKKSPVAMETLLTNMNFNAGETTWYKKYWLGAARPWFTFEIASLGGQVHFYIWTSTRWRRGVESFFYAQYPGIEIIEAEDYSRLIDPNDSSHEMWGTEYTFDNPDPYPIKTYVDYGLEKPGIKPEEQIDPLAQIIELLGSISPQEQFWLQMVFRRTGKDKRGGYIFLGDKTWEDEAQELVKKVKADAVQKRTQFNPATQKIEETQGFPNPTEIQKAEMLRLEVNAGKPGFDVGIRAIYSCERGHFQPSMVTFLINLFRPFKGWNSIKILPIFGARFNDYPWEDPTGHHKHHEHDKLVNFYRRRAYFHDPYIGPWMVMSSEELATLFHVVSSTVETPTLPRIGSATAGAPANLPT